MESFFILGTYSDILLLKPSYQVISNEFFFRPQFVSLRSFVIKKIGEKKQKTELLYVSV